MKKNNNEQELATFTLLNPDFHTLDSELTSNPSSDQEEQKLTTDPTKTD